MEKQKVKREDCDQEGSPLLADPSDQAQERDCDRRLDNRQSSALTNAAPLGMNTVELANKERSLAKTTTSVSVFKPAFKGHRDQTDDVFGKSLVVKTGDSLVAEPGPALNPQPISVEDEGVRHLFDESLKVEEKDDKVRSKIVRAAKKVA